MSQPEKSEPRLITESETANYIGMSRSFPRKARMQGVRINHKSSPPWIQIGRAIRYDIRDLDAWILENRREMD